MDLMGGEHLGRVTWSSIGEIPEEPTKEKREEESQAAIDVTGLATGVNASGCLVADWPLGFVLDTPLGFINQTPEEVGLRLLGASCAEVELMFSSVPRQNNAHWHMKTLDLAAGHRRAVRSRLRTTSRTWGPIGGERLKRDLCFINFLTTKR
ncbi:hypothetical protein D5F01_LYC13021 [Larimichthys crocea]|uniref:Uncharacterized protein n=1 Tax=Larimichthys crocea TaxID=215358 RepID=A0A6G0ICX8_LARCR|nr:hypothetical protein D5F01_LYC13021 [Larimichthys crocea]